MIPVSHHDPLSIPVMILRHLVYLPPDEEDDCKEVEHDQGGDEDRSLRSIVPRTLPPPNLHPVQGVGRTKDRTGPFVKTGDGVRGVHIRPGEGISTD